MDDDFLHPQQPLLASPSSPQKKEPPRHYAPEAGNVQSRTSSLDQPQEINDDGSVAGNITFEIAPRLGIRFTLSALVVNVSLSVLTVITQVSELLVSKFYFYYNDIGKPFLQAKETGVCRLHTFPGEQIFARQAAMPTSSLVST